MSAAGGRTFWSSSCKRITLSRLAGSPLAVKTTMLTIVSLWTDVTIAGEGAARRELFIAGRGVKLENVADFGGDQDALRE
jgi:hypothetical protein